MHIISTTNWNKQQINDLFTKTDQIFQKCNSYFKNKILINVFFEPSTRTMLSFECAMKRLGGQVINFNKDHSSIKKGESYEDTIKTLSQYGDIMVLRHPIPGYVDIASKLINIPIINAGDGNGEHPSQALLDLYTIYKKFGNDFLNKTILFIGDIKNSRTIHSLINLIHLYPTMKIHILYYPGLGPTTELLNKISRIHKQALNNIVVLPKPGMGINIYNDSELNDFVDFNKIDIVYITRRQTERISSSESHIQHGFVMTNEMANQLKENAIIMHPLPRNDEIHPDVDNNHRCYYFKQMEYGVFIRMALIDNLLYPLSSKSLLSPQSISTLLKNKIKYGNSFN